MRAQAHAMGDRNLEAAMTADLARLGVVDPAPAKETAVPAAPERAIPPKPKPKPRPRPQPK